MQNFRARVLEAQFKNSTAKLSQAIRRAKYELDVDTLATYCSVYDYKKASYYNYDSCKNAIIGAYNTKGAKNGYLIYDINRAGKIYNFNKTSSINLIDSCMAEMLYVNRMLDGTYLGLFVCGYQLRLSLDINGETGPNKLGYDIFDFVVSNEDDSLKGYKWNGSNYTQDDIDNLQDSDFGKAIKGNPCSKVSPQMLNGRGCSWYVLHDICPFDNKSGYFRCLP